MATVELHLDTRRLKNDGTYPVKLRIFHQGKYIILKTEVSLTKLHWCGMTESVKKSHPLHETLNQQLLAFKGDVFKELMLLKQAYPLGYSHEKLAAHFKPSKSGQQSLENTVLSFWMHEIQEMTKSQKYGNARVHKITLDVLRKEVDLDIPFDHVNYSFLKKLETTLLHKNLKINSISVYLRALRAIYNQAINKEVVSVSSYPFRTFKIRSEKSVPHVLPLEYLRKLFLLKLDHDHELYRTAVLAKLSFLLGGINFTDLCQLTSGNIINGRVIYTRSKTKKILSIILLPVTLELFKQLYAGNSRTLCGILNDEQLASKERLPYIIRDKNKQFNKRLVQLSSLIDAPVKIRSYTFRYSIANLCKKLGYDVSLISELLGHSYGMSVTSGYLQAYDKDKLDGMLHHLYQEITCTL